MRLANLPLRIDPATNLVEVVAHARDSGLEAMLFEDPKPDGTSVAGIGRVIDVVSVPGGAHAETADGAVIDAALDGNRIAAVATLWQRLATTLEVDGLPSAIGVGGFAFRPDREPPPPWAGFPAALVRLPGLTLRRRRGRTEAWQTADEEGGGSEPSWIAGLLRGTPSVFNAPATSHLVTQPSLPAHRWMAAVDEVVTQLREGRAAKVVLARELVARGDGPLHAGSVLRELYRRQPSCYIFLIPGADGSALVGASPELLVRRDGHRAVSQPMAGTAARGRDAYEDGVLARTLQASEKNVREHEAVVESVRSLYQSTGANSVQIAPRELIRFPNVQHLASTVTAHYTGVAPTALELCAAVHPTAAVGGSPWPEASRLIDEHEHMERGWYAGGVGWIDSHGDGAFAVTLRCGLLWEDGVRLYAGAGVMSDSSSLEELQETDVKFLAFLDALRGSLRTPHPTPLDAR